MSAFKCSRAVIISSSKVLIGSLALFLLCFPKGGIKLSGIPFTWGYLFLFITAFFLLFRSYLKIHSLHFIALLALIPFQVISLCGIFYYGYEYLSFVCSFIISFFLLPWVFFGVLSPYFEKIDQKIILNWIKKGVLFISIYGVLLFFYKIFTKQFFEIPLLTINYHDRNELEALKCIDRGGFFKLISTYNNGNIYGVCLLMLYPIFYLLEKSFIKKGVVRLSLLLTISRTVWLGWILAELLIVVFLKKGALRFIQVFTIFVMISVGLLALAYQFSLNSSFFFDGYLGNRLGQFEVLDELSFFQKQAFDFIFEVIYLGVIRSFGILGLMAFIGAMIAPILLYFFKNKKVCRDSSYDKALQLGLIIYLFIGCADGAILYIPVMCFYWFVSSWLLFSPSENKRENSNFKKTRAISEKSFSIN